MKKKNNDAKYPVGLLVHDLGNIELHFMHYALFEEAKNKWHERTKRIVYEKIYVIMELGDRATPELLDAIETIPCPNKVVITDGRYKSNSSFQMDIYGENYTSGKLLSFKRKYGVKRYLDEFDYITFINTGEIKRKNKR